MSTQEPTLADVLNQLKCLQTAVDQRFEAIDRHFEVIDQRFPRLS